MSARRRTATPPPRPMGAAREAQPDPRSRTVLPIPDVRPVASPPTRPPTRTRPSPPSCPCARPPAPPTCWSSCWTTSASAPPAPSAGPQHPHRRAPRRGRAEVHPLPHHRPVLPHPGGAPLRAQPPHRGHGRDHRDRHLRPRATTPLRPNTCAPLPETLRLNGYSTAQFGKCHEVPVWETSPIGPFDHWPSPGGGFEYFYGFIGGETNQWYPALYENTTPGRAGPDAGGGLPPDGGPGRQGHPAGCSQQKSLAPDKPFFVYFAPGATHAPHHVPAGVGRPVQGQFDQGWDALREETFARQKRLGVIPPAATSPGGREEIPAWADMPEDLKPVLAREMEVYAGFLEYADHHIGRLVDALDDLGVLDDTLIYFIIGDNGASAEGTLNGTFDESLTSARRPTSTRPSASSPTSTTSARRGPTTTTPSAGRTPWTPPTSGPSRWPPTGGAPATGPSCTGPAGITAKGELRHQFAHVIDVAPTVLEVAGLPEPTLVHGVLQEPLARGSMGYAFATPAAPSGTRRSTSRCSATGASTTRGGRR